MRNHDLDPFAFALLFSLCLFVSFSFFNSHPTSWLDAPSKLQFLAKLLSYALDRI